MVKSGWEAIANIPIYRAENSNYRMWTTYSEEIKGLTVKWYLIHKRWQVPWHAPAKGGSGSMSLSIGRQVGALFFNECLSESQGAASHVNVIGLSNDMNRGRTSPYCT